MRNYNCGNLESLANRCALFAQIQKYSDGEIVPRFYNAEDFADYSAGVVWRGSVNETLEYEMSDFDYNIGACYPEYVDYLDGFTESNFATFAPCKVDGHSVASFLNRIISYRRFDKPCCIGFREYEILKNLKYVHHVEHEKGLNSFTFTAEDGNSFELTFDDAFCARITG